MHHGVQFSTLHINQMRRTEKKNRRAITITMIHGSLFNSMTYFDGNGLFWPFRQQRLQQRPRPPQLPSHPPNYYSRVGNLVFDFLRQLRRCSPVARLDFAAHCRSLVTEAFLHHCFRNQSYQTAKLNKDMS